MALKPWDSRIAHYLFLPLCKTAVTPNHITSLGLISGIVGGILFSAYAENVCSLSDPSLKIDLPPVPVALNLINNL